MYTIKVNQFKFIEDERKLESSMFVEGECISTTLFRISDFTKFKDDSRGKTFQDFISDILKRNEIEDIKHLDNTKGARAFIIISYWEGNFQYHMIFYQPVDIFILQNGKTIDKIST